MNIVLTGFMGTGKSEVGKILSKNLGWQFYDTDALIENEVGMKVSEIFKRNGELYFRRAETKTIKLLSLMDKSVISCGGGAVLKGANMDALEEKGKIVCLTASAQVIYERTKNSLDRPLLNVADPIGKINDLLVDRKKAYARCSLTIDTSNLNTSEVANKIIKEYNLI